MRSLLKLSGCAIALVCLAALHAGIARADWTQGEFTYSGKPVIEHHCVPASAAPYPAIILLHGAGPRGAGDEVMEDTCEDLAAAGYYTEFIEYFSQTEDVVPGEDDRIKALFPLWLGEIGAGLDAMGKNPKIDAKRIGMLGYSLGAYLSLSTGAVAPGKVAAIVEYYGGLPPTLHSMATNLPPTLILHGDADTLVPVAQAQELDKLLTQANRPHEMKTYAGAGHAFNFRIPTVYNGPAAKDAWTRALDFFAKYLGGKPAPGT